MNLQEMRWGGRDWIDMAQDRDRWRALVNAVMNFWVPYNVGIAGGPLASPERLCSLELVIYLVHSFIHSFIHSFTHSLVS
jgi:hypothetical protein